MRNSSEPFIGEAPNEDCPRNTNETSDDADSPLCAIDTSGLDLEGAATDKHNENLQANNHDNDANEEPIAKDTLKHVELVVETPVVEDVEDLHPDEAIEDDCVELELLVGIGKFVAKDIATSEVKHEDDCDLVDVLTNDLLPHGRRDKGAIALWWAVEDLLGRWIGSECERREGVHDQVYP